MVRQRGEVGEAQKRHHHRLRTTDGPRVNFSFFFLSSPPVSLWTSWNVLKERRRKRRKRGKRRKKGRYRRERFFGEKELCSVKHPARIVGSLWLWSFEEHSDSIWPARSQRCWNDFRNMINCPTMAFLPSWTSKARLSEIFLLVTIHVHRRTGIRIPGF